MARQTYDIAATVVADNRLVGHDPGEAIEGRRIIALGDHRGPRAVGLPGRTDFARRAGVNGRSTKMAFRASQNERPTVYVFIECDGVHRVSTFSQRMHTPARTGS